MDKLALIFLSSLVAGAINSVAGGGTLITFPALIFVGINPIIANVINTIALWTGSLGGAIGYKSFLKKTKKYLLILSIPSFLGGIAGGILLLNSSLDLFKKIIPFLVLFASLLLLSSNKLSIENKNLSENSKKILTFFSQFLISVYGGYFGAGIGIIMLAQLGFLGIFDIYIANALKNVLALLTNGSASIYFVFKEKIDYKIVFIMIIGFSIGGYMGAFFSQKVSKDLVRKAIIIWGILISIIFFINYYL